MFRSKGRARSTQFEPIILKEDEGGFATLVFVLTNWIERKRLEMKCLREEERRVCRYMYMGR